MNILITGSNGFIGKNLVSTLKQTEAFNLFLFDKDTPVELLDVYTKECDFVFHLAGVNRPKNKDEFMKGNSDFTEVLLSKLSKHNNKAPVLITSSIQATKDNEYGKSKKAGEDLVFEYGNKHNIKVFVYRLPNLFGKWSKPNYNSVIATFCHKIAHDEIISVEDPNIELSLSYIDDVVKEFINALNNNGTKKDHFYTIPISYNKSLGEIANLINMFKESRMNRFVPDMSDEFTKKLYSTYLSFLPKSEFSYELVTHKDERGTFTEFIKSLTSGQVSINVSKPGVTKGNHWHHTKNEKFLVVSGDGLIRFRNPFEEEIIDYEVSGNELRVVDIPTGYTHSILNIGDTDLVTVMWVNEPFDSDNPDTFYLEV